MLGTLLLRLATAFTLYAGQAVADGAALESEIQGLSSALLALDFAVNTRIVEFAAVAAPVAGPWTNSSVNPLGGGAGAATETGSTTATSTISEPTAGPPNPSPKRGYDFAPVFQTAQALVDTADSRPDLDAESLDNIAYQYTQQIQYALGLLLNDASKMLDGCGGPDVCSESLVGQYSTLNSLNHAWDDALYGVFGSQLPCSLYTSISASQSALAQSWQLANAALSANLNTAMNTPSHGCGAAVRPGNNAFGGTSSESSETETASSSETTQSSASPDTQTQTSSVVVALTSQDAPIPTNIPSQAVLPVPTTSGSSSTEESTEQESYTSTVASAIAATQIAGSSAIVSPLQAASFASQASVVSANTAPLASEASSSTETTSSLDATSSSTPTETTSSTETIGLTEASSETSTGSTETISSTEAISEISTGSTETTSDITTTSSSVTSVIVPVAITLTGLESIWPQSLDSTITQSASTSEPTGQASGTGSSSSSIVEITESTWTVSSETAISGSQGPGDESESPTTVHKTRPTISFIIPYDPDGSLAPNVFNNPTALTDPSGSSANGFDGFSGSDGSSDSASTTTHTKSKNKALSRVSAPFLGLTFAALFSLL